MDLLNNLNVVIGIIVGIFGIGGYLFGIIAYLRNKASSSQQKQTKQLQSSQKQTLYQVQPKPLSKLDWMEVLWQGFEDCIRSRDGGGVMTVIGIVIIGAFSTAIAFSSDAPNVVHVCAILFWVIFSTIILLFYVYFVGRRIEKKIESKPLSRRIN